MPLCRGRGLIQQPAVQALSTMIRHGGVEEMCQGMSAKEIEVDGVWMRFRVVAWPWRNSRPV